MPSESSGPGGGGGSSALPAAPSSGQDEPAAEDFWVFGYGSLMWDPGFVYQERRPALLRGYHRALCVLSVLNRGTADCPGLALGLDRGGACRGVAFRIAARDVAETRTYLWAREMPTHVYEARTLPIRLFTGARDQSALRVPALVFVARRDHPQYAGGLDVEAAARLVTQGCGHYGTALDYLRNTITHLDAFGMVEGPLHRILDLAESMAAETG